MKKHSGTATPTKERIYELIRSPIITEKATLLSEYNQVTFKVPVDSSKPEIKAAVEDCEFVPASVQRLVKDGSDLQSGSLAGCLEENDTVTLLLDVAGGMRAKWRKKRMRRLRRKRRKMRQRAR